MAITNQLVQPQVIYIHNETPNSSFIEMRNYLKSIGIQNNDFMLALFDPGLAGVDPRASDLPMNLKFRIVEECRKNYWYFLRECVRIPEQGGQVDGGTPYRLHRGNMAMNFLFTQNFNMFVELPRQHGKTTAAVARYLWIYNFGTTNSEMMFLHKDHGGSKKNLLQLKTLREALPSYLQFDSSIGMKGKKLKAPNTVVVMQNPFNNNKITTFASARSKEAADATGRGLTVPIQYYDEYAFMPWNNVVYNAAYPAFSKASANARNNHSPYGILITTTPGDLLTNPGAEAYRVRNNATPWSERFYDFSYQELVDLIKCNKSSPFFMISYKYQQLGSGTEYFEDMVQGMGAKWDDIRREVMLEWSELANNCPFTSEDLDIVKGFCKSPIREIPFGRFRQYTFQVYEDIDLSYPPIIGVDVAGAEFKDSSCITVIDSRTTRVCATLNCNYMPSDDLAEVIYELVTRYMPNAVVNIELNGGFGRSVVQRLVKTPVKANLYWEIKDKVVEEAVNGYRVDQVKRKVRVYGLNSNKSVRNRLIEILRTRMAYHKDKFIAPILYDEMKGMEVKNSGKVEHSEKTHDDQVFSYLMALYVWYDGKNLMENFGIQKDSLKTDQEYELLESGFEDQLDGRTKINLEIVNEEPDSEMVDLMKWIEENSKFMDSNMLQEKTRDKDREVRDNLLLSDKNAREAKAKLTGVDESAYAAPPRTVTTIPLSAFDLDNYSDEEQGYSPYVGNLSDFLKSH